MNDKLRHLMLDIASVLERHSAEMHPCVGGIDTDGSTIDFYAGNSAFEIDTQLPFDAHDLREMVNKG